MVGQKWRQGVLAPYLFLAPAVALMLVFVYIPIVESFRYSLYDWNSFTPEWTWVGLANYERLLQDQLFWKSILNNIWYAVISVAVQVFLALVLAAILESGAISKRLATVFRTAIFLPAVLAVTIVGITWQMLFRPDTGLINQLLTTVGLSSLSRAWLGEESTAMFAVIGVSQWQWLGYTLILFIVAIRATPRDLYEAARIDGAGAFARFVDITLPQLRDVLLVVALLRTIFMFNNFEIVFLLTGGGPLRATMTLPILVYEQAFGVYEMGRGSAIAVVMFLILIAVMSVYFAFLRKEAD
jgi:ABC-type sugar transport system permease subunit